MPSIEEIVASKGLGGQPAEPEVIPPVKDKGMGFNLGLLLTETGPGAVEDYLDHPMNPNRSRGLAQALRGATGLFGNGLRAALADIIFGGMEYMRERRVAANGSD